jgi:hypothetical protein
MDDPYQGQQQDEDGQAVAQPVERNGFPGSSAYALHGRTPFLNDGED